MGILLTADALTSKNPAEETDAYLLATHVMGYALSAAHRERASVIFFRLLGMDDSGNDVEPISEADALAELKAMPLSDTVTCDVQIEMVGSGEAS